MQHIQFTIDNSQFELSKELFKIMMEYLIKQIYELCSIDHVTNNGVDYYQGNTQWFDDNDKKSNIVCDGYMECDGFDYIVLKDNSKVQYNMSIKFTSINITKFEQYIEMIRSKILHDEITIQYIKDILKCIKPQSLFKFTDMNDVILSNDTCSVSNDHRGSDHIGIKLYTFDKINLGTEFSFNDLAIGLHKIKTKKFNYWYELFCGVKCAIEKNNLEQHVLYIDCIFNHGS